MSAVILPSLLPVIPENIPAKLKAERRWAPWAAKWNPKANGGKGKYGKIPYRADRVSAKLANNSTRGWTSFDAAMRAYLANPDKFAGVGYVLTGEKRAGAAADVFEPGRFVGVDLDHCRDPATGEVAEWAQEVLAKLDTYAEVSPSGTGLRAISEYALLGDCINNEKGVEIYGGTKARFVTFTGQQVVGSPSGARAPRPGVMDRLVSAYGRKLNSAQVLELHLPPLLGDDELPELYELELAPHAANFLAEGPPIGTADNSRVLYAVAVELARSGCTRQQIFSILEGNSFALEIAMNHRDQDYDKALRYLWKHSAGAGEAKAKAISQELDMSFLDLGDEPEDAQDEPDGDLSELLGVDDLSEVAAEDDFDDLGPDEDAPPANRDLAPVKARPFAPVLPEQFLRREPPKWLVKGVLPQASLAVIYGASGSGKSFFTFDMCAAIARGVPWRGVKVKQGRGVYVVAEGAGGFRNRLEAYCAQQDIGPSELDIGFIAAAPNLMDKLQVNELINDLKAFGEISFIVMDTYARVMTGGNENDSKDVGLVLHQCAKIHYHTKALVILVHHSGKDAGAGARGSSALRAAADVEIQISGSSKSRKADITKQKDGEDGRQYGFRLNTILLGEDEDGDDITSCVVEHVEGPVPEAQDDDPKKTTAKGRILEVLTGCPDGRCEKEQLIQDVRAATPLPASGVESPSWKALITRPLDKMVRTGELVEIQGVISLPKTNAQ